MTITIKTTSSAISAFSKSAPFLTAPKNTAGWVADTEFDSLGLSDLAIPNSIPSDYFDMKWLRESEIKHGRILGMLASLGFVVAE
jgi:light-harvesting complex I chlorophyll a/b binding protein 1/light-harvesting complex I chlorophyll a/b binding protein 4